jgi:ubiquitin-activating enzyme E1
LLLVAWNLFRPRPIEFMRQNNRSDPYYQGFGNAQQKVLQNPWYLMISASALGHEQWKNWGMVGVARKGRRRIWLTEMSQIEQSNLSRQFLFWKSDTGKMKSVAVAEAVAA